MTTAYASQEVIVDWLASQRDQMIDLLRTIVDLDSNSYDKAGVDAVGARLAEFLTEHGVDVSVQPLAEYGDVLRAEVPSGTGAPALLMGHRDTVFATGTVANRPFSIRDNRAYGPGVADMKSGVVMNCFVLAAFARHGGAPMPLVGLITGDEEIGSPGSRPFIEAEARRARFALNSEAGRANGNIVVARRGCIFIDINVEGRAAHSGVNFADGTNAIEELAHKIIALQGLTRLEDQVSVNVGLVSGGRSVNTVAPMATAKVDVRYYDPEDRARLLAEVERIVASNTVANTRASWELYGEFPPLNSTAQSLELLATHRRVASSLGITLDGELTAGAADSGFSAAVGTPTICGLGPVGGRYHSEDEYMELPSLLERAQCLALTILSHD